MPFADTTQMLHAAQAGGYAVGAFNAENMEMAQAIVLAAQEARAPVILQTTPSTLRYADPQLYWSNVQALAQRASVPVALHLDHGNSFELCAQALRAGVYQRDDRRKYAASGAEYRIDARGGADVRRERRSRGG